MYRSSGEVGREPVWNDGEFVPFADIEVSPAAAFMSYGLGVFEGLKAQRTADGRILLFRPEENARRFQRSAERLLMPPFPEDRFVEVVREVVRKNLRFVPPAEYGSFYIRPMEHAVELKLGLSPCRLFSVTVYGSPVGSYFRGGAPTGLKLRALDQARCAPGGTGHAKAMGNYAGAIYVAQEWKERDYDDVLYLDARNMRYLTETSGANPFVLLKSGVLVTPALTDQVLAGITRDSAIRIARDQLGMKVEEREISIDEVIDDGQEVFCTGTAWTILSVRQIDYRDQAHTFLKEDVCKALLEVLRGIQIGEREDPFGWTREV